MVKLGYIAASCFFLIFCSPSIGLRPGYDRETGRVPKKVISIKKGYSQTGIISYYGIGFQGKKTANGEIFDKNGLTAAHPSLPFNTRVKVTILNSGKSVIVRINDRGPFKKGRILDLSLGAAKRVGLVKKGTAKATIEVL